MENNRIILNEQPRAIFLFCIIYALHMVEEFTLGFVEWADKYFGKFDWTQNLIGNAGFMLLLILACYLYYKNSSKYLLAGMCGAMWVLANSFIHLSATILGREYSPGLITAVILYIPAGLYFLRIWWKKGILNWKNLTLSFLIGGVLIMLLPTFIRAIAFQSELAKIFHLIE